jgi:O-antigen/teichoic acid export membrane protein
MIIANSLLILSTAIFGHFFNYLFHFVTGRYLPPEQYGLLEGLIALNYILAVVISAFSLSIIQTANKINFKQLQKLSLKLTLVTFIGVWLLYPLVSLLLHFNQPYLYLIFSLQVLFAFVPTLYIAMLQAKLKFKRFALLNVLSPFIKTLTAFGLLLLGFKIFGAVASLVISSSLVAVVSYLLIRPSLKNLPTKTTKKLKTFWKVSKLSFITQLGLTSLYVTDILLVRFFFSPEISGIYAAISVIGKIIFFVSASIFTVSFPVFVKQKTDLVKQKKSFFQATALVGLVSLVSLIGYKLFPVLIVKMLYGLLYFEASKYLFSFAIFMVVFSLFNLNLQFLLALGKKAVAWLAGLTASFQLILLILFHPSVQDVIQISIFCTTLGLVASYYVIYRYFYAKK